MATSKEEKAESIPSTSQELESKPIVKSPMVSMPKVVLTRIDEGGINLNIASKSDLPPKKKRGRPPGTGGIKHLQKFKSSTPQVTKEQPDRNIPESRGRSIPKKDYSLLADMKPRPKLNIGLKKSIKKAALTTTGITKPYSGSAKDLLKKTTLQRRSKITIPPVKKSKPIHKTPEIENKTLKSSNISPKALTVPSPSKVVKTPPSTSKLGKITPSSVKASKKTPALSKVSKPLQNSHSPPKPKLLPMKNTNSDSSDDEFLYDELIEEIGNKSMSKLNSVIENASKTTNITLKPNTGKPPTIVKGGIVKRTDLPPDLKSIASPSKLSIVTNKRKASSLVEIEVPEKKPSPWPISMSPTKSLPGPQRKTNTKAKKDPIPAQISESPSNSLPQVESVSSNVDSNTVSQSSITTARPKIGPKQTAKVVPLSKSSQDDYMSDEYTEVETLDEAEHLIVKDNFFKSSSQDIKTNLVKPTSRTNSGDDPNQDLLKILSDDTESQPQTPIEAKENSFSSNVISEGHIISNETEVQNEQVVSKSPNTSDTKAETQCTALATEIEKTSIVETNHQNTSVDTQTNVETEVENLVVGSQPSLVVEDDHHVTSDKLASSNTPVKPNVSNTVEDNLIQEKEPVESKKNPPVDEEPPVRTVYDLMNDISLKYPSWNLHIIPETNAFCIAQVTKGRLGLPTLKKCIELDPESYYAKVYIHQYHIKRFDNVYDSEESILALIEEIHSIKA